MWLWTCLLLVWGVGARKLDMPPVPPPDAASAGGQPGDLQAPHPLPDRPPEHEVIPILHYDFQPNTGDGSYSFSYETGNGIRAQEEGVLKNEVPEGPGQAVHGVYSYTGPDGVVYSVAYTADERGFLAAGDHLPTPPPVPPEIQAALEQNQAEEAALAAQQAQGAAPPPAEVAYFKHYPSKYPSKNPSNYYNYKYDNNYFRRY